MRQIISMLSCCLCISISISLNAQIFSGTAATIVDNGNFNEFPLTVSGLPNQLDTNGLGLEQVCIYIIHGRMNDLGIWLLAPDGTEIPLCARIGGDGQGFTNTCFKNSASESIFSAWPPFTGAYRPFGNMAALNRRKINPNGVWKLRIKDLEPFQYAGYLSSWSLKFSTAPDKPFPFYSSNLPVIKLSTNGSVIQDEPKVPAQIQVIDNGPGQRNDVFQTNYAYQGPVGVEYRGASSQSFPKKSIGVEIWDANGEDKDVSLLGLPETSDYVLSANFSDKTLMRNALAYELFRRMGRYASRTRFCELIIDDNYQGVYVLTEKIKRGAERLDISRLRTDDTSGLQLSGGYILQIDRSIWPGWLSQFPLLGEVNQFASFKIEYPQEDDLQAQQAAYIQNKVDSFEIVLKGSDYQHPDKGWRQFANEESFVDYLILNELSKNVDGYRLSTYMYKNRDDKADGKLNMGPPWDYDLAFYNADYCDAFQSSGWMFDFICSDPEAPFWWPRLKSDTRFSQNLRCRWQALRAGNGPLSTNNIYKIVDSMALAVDEAQRRNFKNWPILGIYVWPNPGIIPTTYGGEVNKLKIWMNLRLSWMDNAVQQGLAPLPSAAFLASQTSALTWRFDAPAGTDYSYFWDFGDGTSALLPNPEHTYADAGTYTVTLTITLPYGCQITANKTLQVVSTREQLSSSPLQIQPNPGNAVFFLKWPDQSGVASLRLLNTLGQVVLEEKINTLVNEHRLDLNALTPGIYQVELMQGKSIYTQKLIKQ